MLVLIGMDFMRDPIPMNRKAVPILKPPQGSPAKRVLGYWTRLRIKMKILLDANISWKLINVLKPIFGECAHVDLMGLNVPADDIVKERK
jgi:hypothetical protein